MIEYYNAEQQMRHPKEDVINSFQFLLNFSQDQDYQKNLVLVTEYVEDLVNLYVYLKKAAEDNADILVRTMKKISQFNQPDPKKQYVEKVKAIYKRKKEKEQKEKEQE